MHWKWNLLLLAACLLIAPVLSFRWSLDDKEHEIQITGSSNGITGVESVRFSEGHMFASNAGPWLLPKGKSDISFNHPYMTYTRHNSTSSLRLTVIGVKNPEQSDAIASFVSSSACTQDADITTALLTHGDSSAITGVSPSNILLLQTFKSNGEFLSCRMMDEPDRNLHGEYCIHGGILQASIPIATAGWYDVVYSFCDGDIDITRRTTTVEEESSGVYSLAVIEGWLSFHNPYGYLPAETAGLLAFEALRTIATLTVLALFLRQYFYYHDTVINIHRGLLFTLCLGLVEAATWFSSLLTLNYTGEPYCCPYPSTIVASLILTTLTATATRATLLALCLGYGVTRPRLLFLEWLGVVIVTLTYSALAVSSQALYIAGVATQAYGSSGGNKNFLSTSSKLRLPQAIVDVFFLAWICLAASATVRRLAEHKQTAKLEMYRRLLAVIYAATAIFVFVSILFILDADEYLSWPWQWGWAQQAAWETLHWSVLAAMAAMCRPDETSGRLAYATQLPGAEEDDIELILAGATSIADDDDDDDFDRALDNISKE